jgi:hypothetical protein
VRVLVHHASFRRASPHDYYSNLETHWPLRKVHSPYFVGANFLEQKEAGWPKGLSSRRSWCTWTVWGDDERSDVEPRSYPNRSPDNEGHRI